jgi:hypothetical protein
MELHYEAGWPKQGHSHTLRTEVVANAGKAAARGSERAAGEPPGGPARGGPESRI